MAIDQIPGVRLVAPTERVHPHLFNFVTAFCTIAGYLPLFRGEPAVTYQVRVLEQERTIDHPGTLMQGKASGRHVLVIPGELLMRLSRDNLNDSPVAYCEQAIYDEPPDLPPFAGIAATTQAIGQAIFVAFWETNKQLIIQRHGHRRNWPMVLQFANVIRDAFSHGGTIAMFAHIPAVTHFGLTYSAADNGRQVLHNDLSLADIFLLMIDADAAI